MLFAYGSLHILFSKERYVSFCRTFAAPSLVDPLLSDASSLRGPVSAAYSTKLLLPVVSACVFHSRQSDLAVSG